MPALLEQARAAEAAGAATFWASDHLFLREPFAMAAAALGATARPRVALMAVSPHVVHPVQIAMAAATLDELAPGRVILCLGTGAPRDLADAGIEPRRGLRALAEALEIVRVLLAGDTVRHDGEVFRVHGRRLASGRRDVPVYLAASGPRTLELAGAEADGVLLSNTASVEFVRWALDHVARGARGRAGGARGRAGGARGRAGGARERPLARAGLVYAAVSDREADALDRYRRHLAITLRGAHHALNVRLGGGTLDQDALHEAVAREDWERAEALVTDDLVRRHTACGTADRVRERIAAYRAAGLDEIVLGGLADPAETTRTLAAVLGAGAPLGGGR